MSKGKLLFSVVAGWIVIHLGLVILGVVLGVAVTLPFDNHGSNDLRCQEDEVAIHGGLSDWYDPDLPLECVSFEEFPEVQTYDEGYDAGFNDGFIRGLGSITEPKTDRTSSITPVASSWSLSPIEESDVLLLDAY
ncbi:hypothetical protein LCGC14_2700120, partial [marine sediment metagenome]